MNLVNDLQLKEEILKRIKELDFSYSEIVKDADERGMKIDPARLSKWVKGKKGGLTEEQLLWISTRLGIFITLGIGDPIVNAEGKLVFKVGKYDELKAIQRLNKLFPNGKEK